MRGPCAAVIAALAVGGCSVSAGVVGRVGNDGTEFRGHATGYMDQTGTIEMTSADGTKCVGEFHYIGTRTGLGSLRCNDGRQARIQFNALGTASGYGYGITNTGEPVRFTFGLSDARGAQYLAGPVATRPAAPPSAAPRQSILVTGTGFFINGKGHLVTNAHVVDGCSAPIALILADGTSSTGQVVAADAANDLAVVLSQARPTSSAVFAGARYRPGDPVVTFGFPYSGHLASSGTLTTGTISALAGLQDDSRKIQITAPIQPGSSGGPLLDARGQVIGVVSSSIDALKVAKFTGDIPQNINFAIKESVAKEFLQSHDIPYTEGKVGAAISAADAGEIAKNYSVQLKCVVGQAQD